MVQDFCQLTKICETLNYFSFCGFTEVIKSILHKEILIMPIMRQNTDEYNIEVYNKIIFSDINIHYCSQ